MSLDTRFALFAVLHESDSGTLETCCDDRHSVAIGMGELMRQYWIPAAQSSELVRDGAPLRLMLLGEKLIASEFRPQVAERD